MKIQSKWRFNRTKWVIVIITVSDNDDRYEKITGEKWNNTENRESPPPAAPMDVVIWQTHGATIDDKAGDSVSSVNDDTYDKC